MKSNFKIIKIIFLLLLILLVINTVTHHIMLNIEESKIKPKGILVEVNNHNMHVYSEGEKNENPTLIFLSGSATVAPTYDFKQLYSKLINDYHIVVVEKAGYGYSESYDIKRDVDTMVEETREALKLAGEEGEYILLPHSMSGLEALYWSQKYPDEINSIIGLDMALPEHYIDFNYGKVKTMFAIGNAVKFIGLHRSLNFLYPISSYSLSTEEIKQQKYLLYKNMFNKIYYTEGTFTYENALKIKNFEVLNTNMIFFVSNGEECGEKWIPVTEEFAENIDAKIIYLDCGHYIFHYESELIAEKIREFLRN